MLKAADALAGAGYRVRMVSTRHVPWATETDRVVRLTRTWDWRVVDYSREGSPVRRLLTGARFHAAQALASRVGPERLPLGLVARAYSRMHDELVSAIAEEPADFVYGGTTGALAAVATAAGRLGVPYALDLEDFHSAEQTGPGSELAHALATRIETEILPRAAFVTTASPMIGEAYDAKYAVASRPIHNTFSRDFGSEPTGDRLRLYWFSQTLGPGRGLEPIVHAIGRAGLSAELHLRARPVPAYADALTTLAASVAPGLTLVRHDPAPPDAMVRLAQGFDLGLACEEPDVLNRRLCLTNKIFTYLAAGMPMLMSATPAQARLAAGLGDAAIMYDGADVDALADRLRAWSASADARRASRVSARAAADRRWHWEHPDDRGALLACVRDAIG